MGQRLEGKIVRDKIRSVSEFNSVTIKKTIMKTADEILTKHFEEGKLTKIGWWQMALLAMEEYALQFKDKPVTELNERNSVDEGEKSSSITEVRTPIMDAHLDKRLKQLKGE